MLLSSRPCSTESFIISQGCSSVMFLEARKHQDLYVWIAKSPSGPSVKFHCTNGMHFQLWTVMLLKRCS